MWFVRYRSVPLGTVVVLLAEGAIFLGLSLKSLILYKEIVKFEGRISKFSPLRGVMGGHFVARRFAAPQHDPSSSDSV